MLCAEGRIVSTKEGSGGKEENDAWLKRKGERKKLITGNMKVVESGHVKKRMHRQGC